MIHNGHTAPEIHDFGILGLDFVSFSYYSLNKSFKKLFYSLKMKSFAFFGIAFILFVARVTAQYDDSENEIEDNVDAGNAYYSRDSRQVSPYVYTPPSGSCARVSWGRSYCGGFSSGNGGGCDSYCERNLGYSKSYCFPEYCLCHRGIDFGKDCTSHRN